ncbi:predicted protein [Sclerotinia sclerotiorum 1980 UF-70]|uniref:Uncharacterized protein n=1 Tax=Sclerotinia sclerotiorum (strain ATCC 18683 / 1980 / Ss-1) TaxID=665079 RepID=A7F2B1_SCLS1|nr:predicted protein [Sclerotinia sclerotiorum 1980 UF-70]EDN95853.1 predicted protein [Sclerotinia sclerotiorum 1980 UF-70]
MTTSKPCMLSLLIAKDNFEAQAFAHSCNQETAVAGALNRFHISTVNCTLQGLGRIELHAYSPRQGESKKRQFDRYIFSSLGDS